MKKRVLIGAGVLFAVVAAFYAFRWTANERNQEVIEASGTVEVTEVNVAFKTAGRVMNLFAEEGGSVARGVKLAALDSAEHSAQVAQNRANLRNAEAQLEKAKRDLERAEVLYGKEVVSAQQLDAARTGYDISSAQVQQAAAALRLSEVRLRDTVLSAPAAGVVLRKNVEPGETVAAGVPIFTIGDLDEPWVKVYIREEKLGHVKLGQQAQVMTDSYPGKSYPGTVTFISSEAEFTPKNVQTREERVKLVFGVKVSLKNENHELKPGMPADVKISLRESSK